MPGQTTRKFALGCILSIAVISVLFLLGGGRYFWVETQCCGLLLLTILSIAIIALMFAEPNIAMTLINIIDRGFDALDDFRQWLTGNNDTDE